MALTPAPAGWPQVANADRPAQLVHPSAVAIDAGTTPQAVLANRTAPFFLDALEGSVQRKMPGVAADIFKLKLALGPAEFLTWTGTVPDSGSSVGTRTLI